MKIGFLMKDRPDYVARIPADVDWVQIATEDNGDYGAEALALAGGVDAFVGSIRGPVNEALLAAAPKLRMVQRMGVGYDNVDLDAAARRNIPVCNLADVNKDALGEHGMCLMLALARKLVPNHQHTMQADWAGARALCDESFELQGRTLGILGFGKSGYELARRAHPFGMRIIYHARSQVDSRLTDVVGAESRTLEQLFAESDFLSINVSLNPSTQNLIGAELLGRMKPDACLINLARGGIVDEVALADALNAGRLGGAGIDAFSLEPIRADNPLLKARNVVLTSHIAGTTKECTDREVAWALDNVRRYLVEGQPPKWVVNGVTPT